MFKLHKLTLVALVGVAFGASSVAAQTNQAAPVTTAHSPGTWGADFDWSRNHRVTMGLNGSTGLLEIDSAILGPAGVVRLGVWGQYFSVDDLPVSGVENTQAKAAFALAYTPLDFLELYLSIGGVANTNSATDPNLVQQFGKTRLGAKLATDLGAGFSAGADLRLRANPGNGSQAMGDMKFGFEPTAVVSYDFRALSSSIPVLLHLNGGYVMKNTDEDELAGSTPAEELALGIMRHDQLKLGAGLEVPLPVVTPFVEWSYRLLLDDNFVTADGSRETNAVGASPSVLGLGLKVTAIRDLTLTGAVQIGLTPREVVGVAATPAVNAIVGLSYAFDPYPTAVAAQEKVECPPLPPPPPPAKPTTGVISGQTLDAASKSALSDVIVTVHGNNPVASSNNGAFITHQLPAGNYKVRFSREGYEPIETEQAISAGGNTAIRVSLARTPPAKPAEPAAPPKPQLVSVKKDRIEITQQVRFDTNKASIQAASDELLDQIANAIISNGIKKVRIEGHTDNVGKKETNLQLSSSRARSVAEALTKRGVSSEVLLSVGFGDTRPIAPNLTKQGKALNRRVEFIILEQ